MQERLASSAVAHSMLLPYNTKQQTSLVGMHDMKPSKLFIAANDNAVCSCNNVPKYSELQRRKVRHQISQDEKRKGRYGEDLSKTRDGG